MQTRFDSIGYVMAMLSIIIDILRRMLYFIQTLIEITLRTTLNS